MINSGIKLMPANKPPFPPNSGKQFPFSREAGEILRIGNPDLTQEKIEHGERVFHWLPDAHDMELADVAGWGEFVRDFQPGEDASLVLPDGIRPAASALSGMEAWRGEKADILQGITNYQRAIYERLSAYDTAVSLDSTGVTQDHTVLVTPPHMISSDRSEYERWVHVITDDLDDILTSDPNRSELVAGFANDLRDIREQE
jgi:hypothetical protein